MSGSKRGGSGDTRRILKVQGLISCRIKHPGVWTRMVRPKIDSRVSNLNLNSIRIQSPDMLNAAFARSDGTEKAPSDALPPILTRRPLVLADHSGVNLSLTHSLTHSRFHPLSLLLSCTHAHAQTHTFTYSHSYPHAHAHAHISSLVFFHFPTLTLTLTLTLLQPPPPTKISLMKTLHE